MKKQIFLLMLIFSSVLLYSNDGVYYVGATGSVYPTTDSNIKMAREDIEITVIPRDEDHNINYQIHYRCVFYMENTNSKSSFCTIGFPIDYNRYTNSTAGGYSYSTNFVFNFSTRINNINIQTEEMITEDGYVYTFPVFFNAGETKTIIHEYDLIVDPRMSDIRIDYIVGTGNSWKDSIGEANFKIIIPQSCTTIEAGQILNRNSSMEWTAREENSWIICENNQIEWNPTFREISFYSNRTYNIDITEEEINALRVEILNQEDLEQQLIDSYIRLFDFYKRYDNDRAHYSFYRMVTRSLSTPYDYSNNYREVEKAACEILGIDSFSDYKQQIFAEWENYVVSNSRDYIELKFYLDRYNDDPSIISNILQEYYDSYHGGDESAIYGIELILGKALFTSHTGYPAWNLFNDLYNNYKILLSRCFYEYGNHCFSIDLDQVINRYSIALSLSNGFNSFFEDLNDSVRCEDSVVFTTFLNDKFTNIFEDIESSIFIQDEQAPSRYIAYNMACAYSIHEELDNAYTWLERALMLGYEHFNWIMEDSDLSNLTINRAEDVEQLLSMY